MPTTFILVSSLPTHKKKGILKIYFIGVLKQTSSSRLETPIWGETHRTNPGTSLRGRISVHLATAVAAKGLRDGDSRVSHADVDLDLVPIRGTSANLASFRVVALVHPLLPTTSRCQRQQF